MTTIVTRSGKGSTLSWVEADANFTNLNNDKLETSTVGVTVQPHSSNLDSFATVAPTAAGLALLDDVDVTAQRTTLGLGNVDNTSDATKNAATVTLTNKTLTTPIITASQNDKLQIGVSGTATNNFTLTAEAVNGTMKLARGNAGATTQDILTVDANGRPSFPQGGPQFPRAFCIFDGTLTGTNAPLAGFGVASVVRNTAGNYTINFSTTYSDNSHIVSVAVDNGALNVLLYDGASNSSVTIANYVSGVPTNAARVHVTVFRVSN